jgi:hypothetical protein
MSSKKMSVEALSSTVEHQGQPADEKPLYNPQFKRQSGLEIGEHEDAIYSRQGDGSQLSATARVDATGVRVSANGEIPFVAGQVKKGAL